MNQQKTKKTQDHFSTFSFLKITENRKKRWKSDLLFFSFFFIQISGWRFKVLYITSLIIPNITFKSFIKGWYFER